MSTVIDGSASVTINNGTVLGITSSTAVSNPTSPASTSIDFTGIPSWVKRITVMLNGLSLSSTGSLLVQIGTVSSVENTGYTSSGTSTTGASGGTLSSTSGFVVRTQLATISLSGHMVLTLAGPNLWIESHTVKGDTSSAGFGGGDKTLSATLDRVRITTTSTDTFDAGSVNIMYEG